MCCLDPMLLPITTLCALHSVYNDKVSKIGEVPKLLNILLDCQYIGRHRVQLVRRVAQEPLVRGSNPSGARVQWVEGC
jgi:hypothetical protein